MRFLPLLAFALAACATAAPPTPAERWWSDVAALADDGMEGRLTGTAGFRRAADHVVAQMERIGLEPAGSDGWFQPVELEQQYVDAASSKATLGSGAGDAVPVRIPDEMVIGRGDGPRPDDVHAPLIFAGYGLHMPEAGHDDFAGIDWHGKIAVFLSGGPADVPGALKAHARRERARILSELGADGMIALTTPKALEIPWARSAASASQSGMYYADPALREVKGEYFSASFDPAASEKLFARSGHAFADLAALADESKPLPKFNMKQELRARIATRHGRVAAMNVVGRLPGRDPALKAEHVVFSAHLDHLGVGEPVNGDRIFNGAMDNAAGVAGLLDIARTLKSRHAKPKRSLLFLFVTAEEKGLLGSRYFALRPTVPKGSIVADLNFDMYLPIFPLRSVTALGAEESSLGDTAAAAGAAMGLPLVPDPFPDRNSFVRSDQYSFIREGIPALAFKFGFARGTPEAETERVWRSTHYHAVSDDPSQPVFREDAVRLHDFVAELGLRVANAPQRPQWTAESFFRRFAGD
jgi:Zn-dependent M28 family amino/carboxypeptidase